MPIHRPPKPTSKQEQYWDQVLHDHRLGMGRARSESIEYVGGEEGVRLAEQRLVSKRAGRTRPKGAGPD